MLTIDYAIFRGLLWNNRVLFYSFSVQWLLVPEYRGYGYDSQAQHKYSSLGGEKQCLVLAQLFIRYTMLSTILKVRVSTSMLALLSSRATFNVVAGPLCWWWSHRSFLFTLPSTQVDVFAEFLVGFFSLTTLNCAIFGECSREPSNHLGIQYVFFPACFQSSTFSSLFSEHFDTHRTLTFPIFNLPILREARPPASAASSPHSWGQWNPWRLELFRALA